MGTGRVLLIGGSGFIGSNLRTYLPFSIIAPSEKEADLTNIDSLRRFIHKDDVVINAAGYANAGDCTEAGIQLFNIVNVEGVRNLAEAAADAGVSQLIHISSVAAMGRLKGENITEEMKTQPSSPYAISKLKGELILEEYKDRIPVTILRPTSVFGEGRGLAKFFCAAISKRLIPLPDGGHALIPFTYVGNIAKAVELAVGCQACFGKTFIIGDRQSYPLRQIVFELSGAMRKKPLIIPIPGSAAKVFVRLLEKASSMLGKVPIIDTGKIETLTSSASYSIRAFEEATGYAPPYSLSEAARRIVEWFEKNG